MKLNTVLKGDILKELRKLPEGIAQAVIADPPYFNVLEDEGWDTQWKTPEAYLAWCERWARECLRVLRDDGLCFIFGQPGKREHTFLHLMSRLCQEHTFHDLIVWDRVVGYNERRDSFTPQYEMILVLRKGGAPKFNKEAVRIPYDLETIQKYMRDPRYKNLEARRAHLEKGKFATNILRVPSLKGLTKERCGHPSQKPLDLVNRLVACATDAGDLVLDPFMGSGTTAVAAEAAGRQWLGIERSAKYIKITEQRLKVLRESPPRAAKPIRDKKSAKVLSPLFPKRGPGRPRGSKKATATPPTTNE